MTNIMYKRKIQRKLEILQLLFENEVIRLEYYKDNNNRFSSGMCEMNNIIF